MFNLLLSPRFDAQVIVVGAGPAGAATAAHLARRGVDVLLIDRRRFPRDKVCGDFVGPVAVLELLGLGIGQILIDEQATPIQTAALYLDGKLLVRRSFPQFGGRATLGRVVPRRELDAWILAAAQKAGARVIEGHNVTEFEATERGVAVTVEGDHAIRLAAPVVVGADGSTSLVARKVRGTPDKRDRIIALRAYYEAIPPPQHEANLYFSASTFPGYAWLFPFGRRAANVGVGTPLATVPPQQDHLRDQLRMLTSDDPALCRHLEGAVLRGKVVGWPLTTFNADLPVVDDGVVLVGDAAGLINPLNGEGIQYALMSGRWAAETLAEAARTGHFTRDTLAAYSERVRELSLDMGLARAIVQLISNRSLNPISLRVLRSITARARGDERYAQTAGGILAGLLPTGLAASPSFLAATVWQFLADASWSLSGLQEVSAARKSVVDFVAGLLENTVEHKIETFEWATSAVSSLTHFGGTAASRLAEQPIY